jgi:predicted MFS family arabinose efflux permease
MEKNGMKGNSASERPQHTEDAPTMWQILATPQGRVLLLLALAIFTLFFMTLAVFPAAPLVAQELQLSPEAVSAIFGLSTLIATLLSLPAGVLSDRWGRKPLIVGGLLLTTISLLICLGGAILPLFITGWILFGVGRGLFFSPMFTVPADLFDFRMRGRVIGVVTGAVGLGSVVGFVAGGLISQYGGWRALFLVGAVLLAIATLIMTRMPETNLSKSNKPFGQEVKGALKWFSHGAIATASLIAALSFAAGICATFLVPFVAGGANISPTLIALLFIPYELVASFGAPVIGAISDRVGRRLPLISALALVALAAFGLAYFGVSPLTLLICYSLIGLAEGPVVALTTTIVIDQSLRINPRGIGAALGSYRIAQGLGLAFGTSLGGVLLSRFGESGSFTALGLLMLVLAVFALTVRNDRQGAHHEERGAMPGGHPAPGQSAPSEG